MSSGSSSVESSSSETSEMVGRAVKVLGFVQRLF